MRADRIISAAAALIFIGLISPRESVAVAKTPIQHLIVIVGENRATRQYLCRWGGLNVPGGCSAIAAVPKLFETQRKDLFTAV